MLVRPVLMERYLPYKECNFGMQSRINIRNDSLLRISIGQGFSSTLSVEEIMDIKLTLTSMNMKLNKSTNVRSR